MPLLPATEGDCVDLALLWELPLTGLLPELLEGRGEGLEPMLDNASDLVRTTYT